MKLNEKQLKKIAENATIINEKIGGEMIGQVDQNLFQMLSIFLSLQTEAIGILRCEDPQEIAKSFNVKASECMKYLLDEKKYSVDETLMAAAIMLSHMLQVLMGEINPLISPEDTQKILQMLQD